jgi:hypothetical protein
MKLTAEERRCVEEEERRRLSDKQYRAEVRAALQGESARVQKSSLPWLLSIGLVGVAAAIWFHDHFGP